MPKTEWHSGDLRPRVGFIVANLTRPPEWVVAAYNQRGTTEQWIKKGKNAVTWTRLSCHRFAAKAAWLRMHAPAHGLANFLRTLALPDEAARWSLATLRTKLVKIGAKAVQHGRVVIQLAGVDMSRQRFGAGLSTSWQDWLRLSPPGRPTYASPLSRGTPSPGAGLSAVLLLCALFR